MGRRQKKQTGKGKKARSDAEHRKRRLSRKESIQRSKLLRRGSLDLEDVATSFWSLSKAPGS